MKREYVKPFLAVESFQLDAAIAASCSSEDKMLINQSIDVCVESDFGFFSNQCPINVTDDFTDDGGFCYQGPANDLPSNYVAS